MNTLRSRMSRAILTGLAVLALTGVAAETASAHSITAYKARKAAKRATKSLVIGLRADGTQVRRYGVQSCLRLDRHLFSCVTYVKIEEEYGAMTCTQEYAVGVTRHFQRTPIAAYMDDSTDCYY
jgi:hypothetical protein